MRVANPIYDVVFRYLMGDLKIAKVIISNIIGEKIESLDFSFTELSDKLKDGSLTVLRLDFAAKIKQPAVSRLQGSATTLSAAIPTPAV